MTRAIRVPARLLELPARLERAIQNGMQSAAQGVRVDFVATTRTWERGVAFTITKPGGYRRVIGTDDEVWFWLDGGTRPHLIAPRRARALAFAVGGRPKTRPRVLSSSGGSTGSTFVTTRGIVQHPGTKAREWTDVAQEKWQKQLPVVVQRAIDSEV